MSNLTIKEALNEAVSAHRSGNLSKAERLYKAILTAKPDHPDANHKTVLAVSVEKYQMLFHFSQQHLNLTVLSYSLVSYLDALLKFMKVIKLTIL